MNLTDLQSEWEQSTDPDRPTWLTYRDDNAHRLDDYDPTPWCHQCGAMDRERCHCGPIASNN